MFMVVSDGGGWLEVRVPARPNGQTGWVRRREVTLSTTNWRIEADVSERSVEVWQGDHLVSRSNAAVGKSSTPTPLGDFYITEVERKAYANGPYGPWIVGTNGWSETLDTFGGRVPMFALHGTNNPQTLGKAVSNGCLRVPNEVIDLIAREVPVGSPVRVKA